MENKDVLPLTDGLISSMCMRYDHSFGLWDDEEKKEVLRDKMRNLYDLYKNGLKNEEIVQQFRIDNISVKQLREEVEGTGFYKPEDSTSYKEPIATPTLEDTNKDVLPLTDRLITSMCMRYDHSFGLWDDEEKKEVLRDKMRSLYNLYKSGLKDEEIVQQFRIDNISVKQLREEVEGTGFYKPENKNRI